MPKPDRKPGEPYCANCGYTLTHLTESAKCPECGRPLVEVLTRHTVAPRAVRYRSTATIFGLPVIDVAFGPRPEFGEARGKARGIIAIGDQAFGGIAIGGMATGGVAIGGLAFGAASIGGCSIGAVAAIGGLAVGGTSVGGMAVGGLTTGGCGVGFIAQGGAALGYYARGNDVVCRYAVTPLRRDPEAVAMFKRVEPLMGSFPSTGWEALAPLTATFGVQVCAALAVVAIAIFGHWRHARGIGDAARSQSVRSSDSGARPGARG